MADLAKAAKLLWEPVPAPVKPRAKPTQSFRLLKVGQLLSQKHTVWYLCQSRGPDIVWRVVATDNQGASLESVLGTEGEASGQGETLKCRITSADWKEQWTRKKKPKTKP